MRRENGRRPHSSRKWREPSHLSLRVHRVSEAKQPLAASYAVEQVLIQITPWWVRRTHEVAFVFPRAALELLLAQNRAVYLGRHLEVHELPNLVLLGEAVMRAIAMFLNPPQQVVGHSHIEDVVL